MDTESFRIRINKTVLELAELLGVEKAAVYNYKYGKSKPSYDVIEKMFLLGARIDEVFSPEVQAKVLENCGAGELPAVPAAFDTPEFREGVKAALADLQKMGYIKEIGINGKDGQ